MASAVAIVESQLRPMAPRFDALLRGSMMNVAQFTQTMLISVERTPKIAECTPQSLINTAYTFAVLRLPVDGASGQAFILPFKNRGVMMAQPCIGYKGFSSIAARSRVTISGNIVREGDPFDYDEGEGWVKHKPSLDNSNRIIAAWSKAAAHDRPAVVKVLGIKELNEVKGRSPGARGGESPWNDPLIGFPAMCEKTAKRRLARSIPWQIDDGRYLKAARMDEAFDEQGKHSFIREDGAVVVDGEFTEGPISPRMDSPTPDAGDLMKERPRFSDVSPERLAELETDGLDAAEGGTEVVGTWWRRLTVPEKTALEAFKNEKIKPAAAAADKRAQP